MGQSSSRTNRQHGPVPSAVTQPAPVTNSETAGPSTRRSTVGKSILNLVKPRDESGRRTWRHSRRFSKLVHSDSEKGKERELEPQPELDTESDESEPDSQTVTSRIELPSTDAIEDDEVVISPEQFEVQPEPVEPPLEPAVQPGTQEEPQQSQNSNNRSYPPPGTLVVVQGVVHTTDIPRPALNSGDVPPAESVEPTPPPRPPTPAGSERSGARNRLSALLRSRPSSVSAPSPRPASFAGEPSAPILVEPSPDNNTSPLTPPANTPPTSNSISSSSIDVLGTLLSVAAAATAASLLTGSSEPMQNSGLVPPSSSTIPSSSQAESPPPPSPVPTPVASPSPSLGYNSDLGRAERMRQAWGSIRERLGLRPVGERGAEPARPAADSPTTGGLPTPDARERMLAEMARAFNMGLGLGTENLPGSTSTSDNPTPSEDVTASTPLPPEGSFERFLLDLQSDLRVALTQRVSSESRQEEVAPSASSQEGADSSEIPALESDSESEFDGDDENDEEERESDHSSEQAIDRIEPNVDDESSWPSPPTAVEPDETQTSPALQESIGLASGPASSGSETNTNNSGRINWWRLYRFPAITAPRLPMQPDVQSSAANPTESSPLQESRNEEPSAPEASTSSSSLPERSSTPSTPPPPQRLNVVVPVIVVGLQSVNVGWQHLANHPQPPTPNPNTEPTATTSDLPIDETDAIPLPPDPSPVDFPPSFDSQSSSPPRPLTPRATSRRWSTRAANAVRNLRPGVVPSSPSPSPSAEGGEGAITATPPPPIDLDGPGTRTFLIYVIGGYYPPDHTIVTGEPNNLDSFEALLDLAELLGQVKPPTVSKDDIENSGLEVIKANRVGEYEKMGKISSNCTERCLICLDEYDAEDSVRVMSCRHAFHMDCVDKWLQTGRNNCPACRSKGVSSATSPTSPSAPTAPTAEV